MAPITKLKIIEQCTDYKKSNLHYVTVHIEKWHKVLLAYVTLCYSPKTLSKESFGGLFYLKVLCKRFRGFLGHLLLPVHSFLSYR